MSKRSMKSLAKKRKRLSVKKITRSEALSYNRTIPNGLGVTAISAVNGRGAYAKNYQSRYAQTLRVLSPNGDGMFYYSANAKARTAAQKAATKKMREAGCADLDLGAKAAKKGKAKKAAKKVAKKAAKRGKVAKKAVSAVATVARKAVAKVAKVAKKTSSKAAKSKRKGAKMKANAKKSVVHFRPARGMFRRNEAAGFTSAYAKGYEAIFPAKTLTSDGVASATASAKGKKKRKAKKARKVEARTFGGKYKSVRRLVKGGFKQLQARVGDRTMNTYLYADSKGRTRKIPSYAIAGFRSAKAYKAKPAAAERLAARRQKIAESVRKKILAGTYPFTPNAGRTVSFKEYLESTMATKKKSRKKGRRKASRKARRNPLMQAAANKKRSVRKGRKSRSRRKARNISLSMPLSMTANKRRKASRKGYRRNAAKDITSYISNVGGAYVTETLDVIKKGAVIGGGLVAHKVLTNLVVDNVGFFKTTKYGKSIAAVAVAAVGIPVAAKFVPNVGKELAVGMGAALVHTVLVQVLSEMGQAKVAGYLGDYTEADMKLPPPSYNGVGSYYEFAPGQSYSGMGSYYEFAPGQSYSGMGEYIQQQGAIAGLGDAGLMQAAAGMGNFNLMQAAAGMGDAGLMQAAAGVGEYIVTGAQGIGEYEQVTPEYTAPAAVREGIAPSLSAAEDALTVAEAAAGVGGFGNVDLGLQQIVYPKGQALDITDSPGGSRSGVFYGQNGIFQA